MNETFERSSTMPASSDALYQWHVLPGAFERLAPPWRSIEVVERSGGVDEGGRLVMKMGIGLVNVTWEAVHGEHQPGRQFVDVQKRGPFSFWRHEHRFEEIDSGSSRLTDRIEYRIPLGSAGKLLQGGAIRKDLERTFAFRHARTACDLKRHAKYADRPRMRIAVSGASGLVGSQVAAFLSTGGHEVVRIVRGKAKGEGEVGWNVDKGGDDLDRLNGFDAVVHLAGESIAQRWTESAKERIRKSRVDGTQALCERLARLANPPKVFACASAVGIYGSRTPEQPACDEDTEQGTGFLADVCRGWEQAVEPMRKVGSRVVNLRFGVVVSAQGGALAKMLTPFKAGVGGVVGSGRQGMSWIALDDVVGAIHHVLQTDGMAGPVNVTAPELIDNRAWTKTLGRVLHRPTVAPLPGFVVKVMFGEMGERLLLEGALVQPKRLLESGFEFLFPDAESALRMELGLTA